MRTIVCALLAVALLAMAPSTRPSPSQTVAAQRVVSIVWGNCDADVARRVVLRARSPENVDAVVAKTVGAPTGQNFHMGKIEEVKAADGVTRLIIETAFDNGAPQGTSGSAKEVADALVVRLREMLEAEAIGTLATQLDAERQRQDSAQKQLDEVEREMSKLRKALRDATGRVDVTPADVRKEISSYEEQRQAATLALEQKHVRNDVLAASIAKLSAEAEKRGKEDPVAAELEKVVAARRQTTERLRQMHGQGTVSSAEVSEAEAAEAEATAKLLERRQSAMASIAGDTLPAWNRELLSLGIERAELEARAKLLSLRLERLSSVVGELDRFDQLAMQRDRAHHELHAAEKDVRALKQRMATVVLPEAFVESASQQAAQ